MSGRICLLFGGTGEIGRAILDLFIGDGFRVAFASRSDTVLEYIRDEHKAHGDKLLGIRCNITEEIDIYNAVESTLDKLGSVDVLVNSAGINSNHLLMRTQKEEIARIVDTNLVGSMLTCKAVLRGMLQKKHGTIINIGSVVGSVGNVGQTVYSASKAGLVGFTRSLAKEVASRGITANVVAPGFVLGGMSDAMSEEKRKQALKDIPVGRMGDAMEVAQLVRFLVDARYITGQVIHIDGGISMS